MQPSLFQSPDGSPEGVPARTLDSESEAFLRRYATHVSATLAPHTVRGEVSQLRSTVRQSALQGGPATIPELLAAPPSLARVLATPQTAISRSTALARLRAVQTALLLWFGKSEGARMVQQLDELLPSDRTGEWHRSGVLIGGQRSRRRPQSVTVDPTDLGAIIAAAGQGKDEDRVVRDSALVATLCFSGLRIEEVRSLSWTNLRWEPDLEGWSAPVERGGRKTRLGVFGPGAAELIRLRATLVDDPRVSAWVFPAAQGGALSTRQIRKLLLAACTGVGFPHADRTTILSALAAYLHAQGLTDHEIAIAIGKQDLRTVDRLLAPHTALEGQRKVADAQERSNKC